MNILGIDLGTKTGYAHNLDGPLKAGTWTLATAKEICEWGRSRLTRRADPRATRLFGYLLSCRDRKTKLDLVVFEDVQFSMFTFQTQLWSSLRAMVWAVFDGKVHLDCVPTGTLKKFATGHGGATKEMMKNALSPEWKLAKLDDNATDAIWIWRWAECAYKRTVL